MRSSTGMRNKGVFQEELASVDVSSAYDDDDGTVPVPVAVAAAAPPPPLSVFVCDELLLLVAAQDIVDDVDIITTCTL